MSHKPLYPGGHKTQKHTVYPNFETRTTGPPLHQRSTVSLCPWTGHALSASTAAREPSRADGQPRLLQSSVASYQPCDIALRGWPPCCQLYQLHFPAWPATADCHSRHKPYPDWAGSDNEPAREQTRLFSRSSCHQGSPGACQASAGRGIGGVKAAPGARLGARHVLLLSSFPQRSFSLKKSAHGW